MAIYNVVQHHFIFINHGTKYTNHTEWIVDQDFKIVMELY